MLTRRGFLSALATAAAGLTLDPERLLWVPGQRTFFLPSIEPAYTLVQIDWMTREMLAQLHNQLAFAKLVNRQFDAPIVGATIRVPLPARYARGSHA